MSIKRKRSKPEKSSFEWTALNYPISGETGECDRCGSKLTVDIYEKGNGYSVWVICPSCNKFKAYCGRERPEEIEKEN